MALDRFLSLFGPLAWPLAIVTLALIFRRDVGQALGRVGQVKYRDLELTFREDLHQAERLARTFAPPAAQALVIQEVADDEAKPLEGRLIVSPSTSNRPVERPDAGPAPDPEGLPPREAIEAAWVIVARSLARGKGKGGDHRGRWPGPEGRLIGILRGLRDRAARSDLPPPSEEDARRFAALARRVAQRIDELC